MVKFKAKQQPIAKLGKQGAESMNAVYEESHAVVGSCETPNVSREWLNQQMEKLYELALEHCYAVEKLPASEAQTRLSVQASELMWSIQRLGERLKF